MHNRKLIAVVTVGVVLLVLAWGLSRVEAPSPASGQAPGQAILDVHWTPAATARLNRVPPFVQDYVRAETEAYVREKGRGTVTEEDLVALRKLRVGEGKAAKMD